MSSRAQQTLAAWQGFLSSSLEERLARHRHDGSETSLLALFHDAAESVPAYRSFLAAHGSAPRGFAPIAIGLCLTLIHLISIPVTNTSVNPARSTGPAIFVGGWALAQLWLFWLAPLIGGCLGGVAYRWLLAEPAAIPAARGVERAA